MEIKQANAIEKMQDVISKIKLRLKGPKMELRASTSESDRPSHQVTDHQ
jgi:hypothetical protein